MQSHFEQVLYMRRENPAKYEQFRDSTEAEMATEKMTNGKVISFTYYWIFGRTYTSDLVMGSLEQGRE